MSTTDFTRTRADVGEGWTGVCTLADLAAGRGAAALVGETQVAVFATGADGGWRVHAVSNHDPISGANVLSRGLVGSTQESVYVASPLYKDRFDLETGQCLDADDVAIPVFPARLNGDRVEVAVDGAR